MSLTEDALGQGLGFRGPEVLDFKLMLATHLMRVGFETPSS